MGSLTIPGSGLVYIDTAILIYTVEQVQGYFEVLKPLWSASREGTITVASSELVVTESLTGPLRDGNQALIAAYEEVLNGTEVQLIPVSRDILREAAGVRARSSLRTPDAIHAATALRADCVAFITNDLSFRSIKSLPVQILKDLVDD